MHDLRIQISFFFRVFIFIYGQWTPQIMQNMKIMLRIRLIRFLFKINLRLHMPSVQCLLSISLLRVGCSFLLPHFNGLLIQYFPPLVGLGLLQSLCLDWRQSGLQVDHEDHKLQVPSTTTSTNLKRQDVNKSEKKGDIIDPIGTHVLITYNSFVGGERFFYFLFHF